MIQRAVRKQPGMYPATRASGFGLVELMVSMAIGLVIIAALVALFLGTSRNNREMATASSVIENGRFAIELLEGDLVHAGFWGEWVPHFDDQTFQDLPDDAPTAVPDACLAYDPADWDAAYFRNLIGIPIQVYEATDPALPCAALLANRVADSDVLIVRHADMCVPGVGNCEPDTNGKIYIQTNLCADATTDPTHVIGTDSGSFTLTQRNCLDTSAKRAFVSHIYYVRNYAATPGDGIPTLVRSEFDLVGGTLSHQPPEPLIEGVESLRVEIGVDDRGRTNEAVNYAQPVIWVNPLTKEAARNRGDGVPDGNFVRCTAADPCTADQLMNATAARVYVLARSREATAGYTDTKSYILGQAGTIDAFGDGFKRHVYSSTVRLINVSGRRERP